MTLKREFYLAIMILLLLVVPFGACERQVSPHEKLGISITPMGIEPRNWYKVTCETALDTAKEGRFKTIWFPVLWEWVEQSLGVYEFDTVDTIIKPAVDKGFDVGVRLMFIATGNDGQGNFSSVLQIPAHVNSDLSSPEFKVSFSNFCRAFARHYSGKVKYITVANSINNYFEQFPEGADKFDHFMSAYTDAVSAIHEEDPNIVVMPDLDFGGIYQDRVNSRARFLRPFLDTESNAIGFIVYLVEEDIYGTISYDNMAAILDTMNMLTGNRQVYIVETAMFSKPPSTEELQSNYVELLLATIPQRDFIMGMAWFVLYDAVDLPEISWDFKGGFGFFDENGVPKKAWGTWRKYAK